jgi:hypothetical protein
LPDAISLLIQQRNSITFCANLRKGPTETLAVIRQAFEEESMNSQWKSPNSKRRKMERHVQSKVKSMLIIFIDIKGIVNKEFVLAGQRVNSTCYCDALRRFCERLREDFAQTMLTKELTVVSRQRTVSHFLSHQGIFDQK